MGLILKLFRVEVIKEEKRLTLVIRTLTLLYLIFSVQDTYTSQKDNLIQLRDTSYKLLLS